MRTRVLRFLVCVPAFLCFCACPRYAPGEYPMMSPCVDGIAAFGLLAWVVDDETGAPIEGATVFLTNQLDPWSDPDTESLGESDESGAVDVRGWYWFGNCWSGLDPAAVDGAFSVAIAKPGYRSELFSITASDWPRRGLFVEVDLGEVRLERE